MSPRYRSRVSNAKGNARARNYGEVTAKQIDQEVRKLLDDAYELARRTLLADRDKLEAIAKGLLEYQTLDDSQIKEIGDAKSAWFIGSQPARSGGSDLDRTR